MNRGCAVWENQRHGGECTVADVSYPPEVEDSLQLFVNAIQEDVRPGGPVSVYRRHGWHVLLQVQEILLHLSK